jgi:hypothetical protein
MFECVDKEYQLPVRLDKARCRAFDYGMKSRDCKNQFGNSNDAMSSSYQSSRILNRPCSPCFWHVIPELPPLHCDRSIKRYVCLWEYLVIFG